jgi:hypothetical protein
MSPLDSLSISAQSAEVSADNAPSLQEQLFGQQDSGLASLQSALSSQNSSDSDSEEVEDPEDLDDFVQYQDQDQGQDQDEDEDPEGDNTYNQAEANPLASLVANPLSGLNESVANNTDETMQDPSASSVDEGLANLHIAAEASRDPNLDILDAAAKAARSSQQDSEPEQFATQGMPLPLAMLLSTLSGGCNKPSSPLVYIANVTINIGQ